MYQLLSSAYHFSSKFHDNTMIIFLQLNTVLCLTTSGPQFCVSSLDISLCSLMHVPIKVGEYRWRQECHQLTRNMLNSEIVSPVQLERALGKWAGGNLLFGRLLYTQDAMGRLCVVPCPILWLIYTSHEIFLSKWLTRTFQIFWLCSYKILQLDHVATLQPFNRHPGHMGPFN